MSADTLVKHLFRDEYARLVALLCRRVGVQHLELVEDAAQRALMSALESWRGGELPDSPAAWLHRVASNHLLEQLRSGSRRRRLLEDGAGDLKEAFASVGVEPASAVFLNAEFESDLLHMLFVCCDERLPTESQLVLALKTLCAFDVQEIAQRLFQSEANVYKRLSRARMILRASPLDTHDLAAEKYAERLPVVHQLLYLLFTEGHLSLDEESPISGELCAEAIRLTRLLLKQSQGKSSEGFALLALMLFHQARIRGRQSDGGALLLLEEQDRSVWDRELIFQGLEALAQSAEGDNFSRYHAEAGIAAEHCLAPSFAEINWQRVAACYELLERAAPSPLHRMNRALAVAEIQGSQAALALLLESPPPSWLCNSYQWEAVLADLHRRNGSKDESHKHRKTALKLAPTSAIKELLLRRLIT